jgi:hypothetical protein
LVVLLPASCGDLPLLGVALSLCCAIAVAQATNPPQRLLKERRGEAAADGRAVQRQ